ncbi:hypothetical protein ACN47E_005202 [Coniothyrium glycines]
MSALDPYIILANGAYHITLTILSATLRLIWWPIRHLLYALIVILRPLCNLVAFLLLPLSRFGQAIFHILSFPFQVKWSERIETLYVFLGTAGLVGCMTGAIVFLIFRALSSSLKIHTAAILPQPSDSGRTAAEYRSSRRPMNQASLTPAPQTDPTALPKAPILPRRRLFSQAIVEQDDSDF